MDQQNSAQPAPQAAAPAAPVDASTAPAPVAPAAPAQPAAAPSDPAPTTPPAPTTGTPSAVPAGSPAPAASGAGTTAPAKKSSAKALIILLILLVLAVIGAVGYELFMAKGNSMTQSSYKSATVSPTAMVPAPTVGAVKSGDAKVDQQSDAIDQNMQSLGTDVKNVDSGLQDQSDNLNQ